MWDGLALSQLYLWMQMITKTRVVKVTLLAGSTTALSSSQDRLRDSCRYPGTCALKEIEITVKVFWLFKEPGCFLDKLKEADSQRVRQTGLLDISPLNYVAAGDLFDCLNVVCCQPTEFSVLVQKCCFKQCEGLQVLYKAMCSLICWTVAGTFDPSSRQRKHYCQFPLFVVSPHCLFVVWPHSYFV